MTDEDQLRKQKMFWLSKQSKETKQAIKEDEVFRKAVSMFWSPDMYIRYRRNRNVDQA